PVESGRGVERAVRGAAYADCPPFPGGTQGAADAGPFGTVLAVALRSEAGAPRPIADIDLDCAEACARALRAGGRALLVLLDVSKTGLRAPSPDCAADLKGRYGERLTVLVDACQ